jgi:hypothetical protein
MKGPIIPVRLLTCALVLVNLCGLTLLIHRAWQGTQAARLLATEPRPFSVPKLDTLAPARPASLGVIQDQALFYASRHFYTPPPPSAAPVMPPRPDYKLAGTLIIPSKPTVALLTGSAGVSRKIKTGDDLDGWMVQAIETGRVTLQYGSTMFDILGAQRNSNVGIRVVPLTQTAQTGANGGIRLLGGTVQGALQAAPVLPSNYSGPNSSPLPYRPPSK